jgi:hypothetical protein
MVSKKVFELHQDEAPRFQMERLQLRLSIVLNAIKSDCDLIDAHTFSDFDIAMFEGKVERLKELLKIKGGII